MAFCGMIGFTFLPNVILSLMCSALVEFNKTDIAMEKKTGIVKLAVMVGLAW